MAKIPKFEAILREAMHHASNFYLEKEAQKNQRGEPINYHDLTIECIGEFIRTGGDLLKENYCDVRKEIDGLVEATKRRAS
ncbi:MAG: hypothetical protein AABX93_01610 [Nanoarchaeota archaeon]